MNGGNGLGNNLQNLWLVDIKTIRGMKLLELQQHNYSASLLTR